MESISPSDYKVTFTDRFFFDTNIWLLLYGTIAHFQEKDQKQYSRFFANILERENPIYITSLVLSEFANVLLRKDFNQWVSINGLVNQDFKRDFVGTSEYTYSVEIVSVLINKILALPNILRISDDFTAIDISSILKQFKIIDYNDSYFLEMAESKELVVVTNDSDLLKIDSNITVISLQN